MTLISIPNETGPSDKRTAMTPANVGKLMRSGADVLVESGLGISCGFSDDQYRESGARMTCLSISTIRTYLYKNLWMIRLREAF